MMPMLLQPTAVLKCIVPVMFLLAVLAQQSPAQSAQQQVVRKSAGVLVGSATKRIEPDYPAEARQRGVSGTVVVLVTIDEKGRVVSANPLSGPEMLREAAVKAARRWTFMP